MTQISQEPDTCGLSHPGVIYFSRVFKLQMAYSKGHGQQGSWALNPRGLVALPSLHFSASASAALQTAHPPRLPSRLHPRSAALTCAAS